MTLCQEPTNNRQRTIGYGPLKQIPQLFYLLPNISDRFFQLSALFYQCQNIPDTFSGDEMNSSQLELRQERGQVELL